MSESFDVTLESDALIINDAEAAESDENLVKLGLMSLMTKLVDYILIQMVGIVCDYIKVLIKKFRQIFEVDIDTPDLNKWFLRQARPIITEMNEQFGKEFLFKTLGLVNNKNKNKTVEIDEVLLEFTCIQKYGHSAPAQHIFSDHFKFAWANFMKWMAENQQHFNLNQNKTVPAVPYIFLSLIYLHLMQEYGSYTMDHSVKANRHSQPFTELIPDDDNTDNNDDDGTYTPPLQNTNTDDITIQRQNIVYTNCDAYKWSTWEYLTQTILSNAFWIIHVPRSPFCQTTAEQEFHVNAVGMQMDNNQILLVCI